VAFEVSPGDLAPAVAAVRALGIGGLSVTMPHKAAILPMLDDVSAAAVALDAVNSVRVVDGRLSGENTDGRGFVAGLHTAGFHPAGATVGVIGAGGAARAIIAALGAADAASVVVVNRTTDRARAAAALAGGVGRVGVERDLAAVDLIVNATSVGMATATAGGEPPSLPMDASLIQARQVVVDAVYHPVRTPLLIAAAAAGARTVDGVGMLVGQAAVSFEWWTGVAAPVAAMRAAAATALEA
jgi:shikimate dehydrogenase